MTTQSTLIPCPLCDGAATIKAGEDIGTPGPCGYYPECSECGCTVGKGCDNIGFIIGQFDTPDEAAAAWNTRPDLHPVADPAESYREGKG